MSKKLSFNWPKTLKLKRYPEGMDEYPATNLVHDARLHDPESNLCFGVLFGMFEEDREIQEKVVRAISAHDALVKIAENTLNGLKANGTYLFVSEVAAYLKEVEEALKVAKG